MEQMASFNYKMENMIKQTPHEQAESPREISVTAPGEQGYRLNEEEKAELLRRISRFH